MNCHRSGSTRGEVGINSAQCSLFRGVASQKKGDLVYTICGPRYANDTGSVRCPTKKLPLLFENNRRWAERVSRDDPSLFSRLAEQQEPDYLWIGCSDSRVPPNDIVGLLPGELFVHRNVANMVIHTDINCLSVLQFAVEVLKIRHIIVCGHYGCGGVRAATEDRSHGLIDNWLSPIRRLYRLQFSRLSGLATPEERLNRLSELNVIEQVKNVASTTIVREAWRGGLSVTVHGWIYGIADGLLKDLDVCMSSAEDLRGIEGAGDFPGTG
jgi:carbonic anhydrase